MEADIEDLESSVSQIKNNVQEIDQEIQYSQLLIEETDHSVLQSHQLLRGNREFLKQIRTKARRKPIMCYLILFILCCMIWLKWLFLK